MTTIITDGKSMAADKMGVYNERYVETTKITRVGDKIIGISGCYAFGLRLIKWYKNGANYDKFPSNPPNWQMVIISKNGIQVALEHGIVNMPLKYVAIGCGQDFALSAAHLGKTLEQAVEFASSLDVNSGMGVDILHLKDKT